MKKLFSLALALVLVANLFAMMAFAEGEVFDADKIVKVVKGNYNKACLGIDAGGNVWAWGTWIVDHYSGEEKQLTDPIKMCDGMKFRDIAVDNYNRLYYVVGENGKYYPNVLPWYDIETLESRANAPFQVEFDGINFISISIGGLNMQRTALLDSEGNFWSMINAPGDTVLTKFDDIKFVSVEISRKGELYNVGGNYWTYDDNPWGYTGVDTDGIIWEWKISYIASESQGRGTIERTTPKKIGEIDSLANASTWARDSIIEALGKGFIPEDIKGMYTKAITRLEFCDLVVKWLYYADGRYYGTFLQEHNVDTSILYFDDVPVYYKDKGTYYPFLVTVAYGLGIMTGTSDKTFDPDGLITREQAATIIQRACKVMGIDVSNITNTGFADISEASSWAIDGINFCRNAGIMNGVDEDRFDPKGTYTREQSIVTFNRISIAK